MKLLLLIICFAASVIQAADKPVRIKFKDKSELEGIVSTSISDTQGFTLKTKFGETHYNWNQIDINDLRQSNPELYQFYVQQSHGRSVNASLLKIKLRDGTVLEGSVTTSQTDTRGFTFRSQFGSRYYEWTQIDLEHLKQSKPELYQFYLQQSQIDDIKTDEQIIQFVKGKFVFRSEANVILKNYGRVLDQVTAAMRIRQVSQRNQQLATIVSNSRPVLQAVIQKCQVFYGATRSRPLQSLLLSYRNAYDALVRTDYASFAYNHKFVQEALAGMQQ
ncbi:MAG: hypothetical protein HZC54_18865 [Verrucomicrobia bacterium]|nr:hypothetical protein [Verrucomicrobiota bacterium]